MTFSFTLVIGLFLLAPGFAVFVGLYHGSQLGPVRSPPPPTTHKSPKIFKIFVILGRRTGAKRPDADPRTQPLRPRRAFPQLQARSLLGSRVYSPLRFLSPENDEGDGMQVGIVKCLHRMALPQRREAERTEPIPQLYLDRSHIKNIAFERVRFQDQP